jgi:formylglycine-generating enzyme required for sulfatase activity
VDYAAIWRTARIPVRDVEPGDVTPLGVFGLAGGVSEWTRDSIEDYDGQCWAASPLTDGACLRPQSENRTVRGAAWTAEDSYLFGKRRFRSLASAKETMIGFRCAYPSRVQE